MASVIPPLAPVTLKVKLPVLVPVVTQSAVDPDPSCEVANEPHRPRWYGAEKLSGTVPVKLLSGVTLTVQ